MKIPCAMPIAMVALSGAVLLASGLGCTSVHGSGAVKGDVQFDDRYRQSQRAIQETDGDLRTWREGVEASESGAYEKAVPLFESLSRNGSTEELRLRALYALACSRLAAAKSQEEINSAMGLLERWSQSAPVSSHDEDSRLMMAALRRLVLSLENSQSVGPRAVSPTIGKPLQPPQKETIKVVRDRECEVLLRSKDRDIQSLRHQIGVLKHQIEALEKIHREIQQKKEQVSPP
jgi:hypothetical protein